MVRVPSVFVLGFSPGPLLRVLSRPLLMLSEGT